VKMNAKRRARRIASDEAHAWARNLRLGNLHAKMVLSMLSLYVDGDGEAYVAISSLAEDCELSADTVRKRLAWLEEVGAITRKRQWIDEKGRRNSEGRGRQTTDLIRLLLDADLDEIEARAKGREIPVKTRLISPSCQQGLNAAEDSVSTAPGLGQPLHCSEGLISEPEPKQESPLSPQGGEGELVKDEDQDEAEPEDFAPAWSIWPGHEIMRRDLALAEFRRLPRERQRLCRAAIPHFVAMQKQMKRDHYPNFHLWIRNAGFDEFPNARLDEIAPPSTQFPAGSVEARAIKILLDIAGRASAYEAIHARTPDGSVSFTRALTPRVVALAQAPDPAAWVTLDRNQAAAWEGLLRSMFAEGVMRSHMREGSRAPWHWPPRVTGELSKDGSASEGDAA
jgi:hypothetical protein